VLLDCRETQWSTTWCSQRVLPAARWMSRAPSCTILKKMETQEGIADVITYNTLAKGYSRAGRMDKCLEVYENMREKGFVPTQVTYGILLDGYINDGQVEKAAWVFEVMVQEGCPMNTVLLTTLMKGLAQAGRIDQAMEIYKRMLIDGEAMPDLVTFSVLIKANCKAERQDVAMGLLNAMKKAGVQPDAYIYNHLIAGCADMAKAQQARQLYQEMVSSGIKPTNITLSVIIRGSTRRWFHPVSSPPTSHCRCSFGFLNEAGS